MNTRAAVGALAAVLSVHFALSTNGFAAPDKKGSGWGKVVAGGIVVGVGAYLIRRSIRNAQQRQADYDAYLAQRSNQGSYDNGYDEGVSAAERAARRERDQWAEQQQQAESSRYQERMEANMKLFGGLKSELGGKIAGYKKSHPDKLWVCQALCGKYNDDNSLSAHAEVAGDDDLQKAASALQRRCDGENIFDGVDAKHDYKLIFINPKTSCFVNELSYDKSVAQLKSIKQKVRLEVLYAAYELDKNSGPVSSTFRSAFRHEMDGFSDLLDGATPEKLQKMLLEPGAEDDAKAAFKSARLVKSGPGMMELVDEQAHLRVIMNAQPGGSIRFDYKYSPYSFEHSCGPESHDGRISLLLRNGAVDTGTFSVPNALAKMKHASAEMASSDISDAEYCAKVSGEDRGLAGKADSAAVAGSGAKGTKVNAQ
ncbi:MAG: hypothetical protein HY075_06915 [Deltaproteobacteria bacterium]|nr:hypothetical protein [Deltaproteobacteria bacterium]